MLPLPLRSPAKRLRDAREDHARCLSLAAWYRDLHRRGEPGNRDRHAWVLDHARVLRGRFIGLSAARKRPKFVEAALLNVEFHNAVALRKRTEIRKIDFGAFRSARQERQKSIDILIRRI